MPHVTRIAVSPADMDDAIRRYLEGEAGLNRTAESIGVSNSAIKTELRRRGLAPLTQADAANQRRARDPEWVKQFARVAGESTKGKPRPEEYLERRAQTFERLQLKVTPANLLMAELLRNRGIEGTMELAVGRYNVDIAVAPVAVEIHVSPAHPLGTAFLRQRTRTRNLCDRGWNVVYVWVSHRYFLSQGAADDVAAYIEASHRDPAMIGEYRVIRGTGEFVSSGRPDRDEWT